MVNALVIAGSGVDGVIVTTPDAGMPNVIVSAPDPAAQSVEPSVLSELALMIASRSVHWPSEASTSAALSTCSEAACTDPVAMGSATATVDTNNVTMVIRAA